MLSGGGGGLGRKWCCQRRGFRGREMLSGEGGLGGERCCQGEEV